MQVGWEPKRRNSCIYLCGDSGGAEPLQRSRKRKANRRQSAWSPVCPAGAKRNAHGPGTAHGLVGGTRLWQSRSKPTRHLERYTLAVLKSAFFGDAPAQATLAAATKDTAVTVLSTRPLKDFKP